MQVRIVMQVDQSRKPLLSGEPALAAGGWSCSAWLRLQCGWRGGLQALVQECIAVQLGVGFSAHSCGRCSRCMGPLESESPRDHAAFGEKVPQEDHMYDRAGVPARREVADAATRVRSEKQRLKGDARVLT